MAEPIIRKVKDAVVEWATKSWPLGAHLEFDAESGKQIRRQTIETVAGPEVVGIAHMVDPDRFVAAAVPDEHLPADDAQRLRSLFRMDIEEED